MKVAITRFQPGLGVKFNQAEPFVYVIATSNSRVFLSEPWLHLKTANRPEIRHVITHLVDYVLGH